MRTRSSCHSYEAAIRRLSNVEFEEIDLFAFSLHVDSGVWK